jgi:hypothetical protein
MTSTYWFGRRAPETAVRAWGARAIYQSQRIELVWDRQSWQPDQKPPQEFEDWINEIGLPWLRQECKDLYLRGDSSDVLTKNDGPYTIEASPQRSFGYLYIVAYERAAT